MPMEAVERMGIEPARKPAPWRRIDLKWLVIGRLRALVVAYLALMPLVFLLWQSFLTPQTAPQAAEFTLRQLHRHLQQSPRPCACWELDPVRLRQRRCSPSWSAPRWHG